MTTGVVKWFNIKQGFGFILLLGAWKLPGMARTLGQSLRIFRSEVHQMKHDDQPRSPASR